MNKIITSLFTIITSLCLVSCLTVATELKKWVDIDDIDDISGKYHFLSSDDIKIYLPDSFKKYALAEYEQLLDSLATKKNYQLEVKRLQSLREMDGHLYIFFDENTRSTYTINTMPYMPLYKSDAKYILGMIAVNNKKVSKNTDLEFTKITAKYRSNSNAQIFKAIYKIDNAKKLTTTYNSTYIISSNKKTIYVQLLTGFDVDFDPFLQKMIL